MKSNEYESWDLAELAALPPDHPGRPELQRRLAEMGEENRDNWVGILADAGALRRQLSEVDAPSPAFLDRLGQVPEKAPRQSRLRLMLEEPIGWRHIAAVLLIGAGVATYLAWPERQVVVPTLDARVASTISELALAGHARDSALELASPDREKVQAALGAHQLPFAPALLSSPDDCTLVGEAVVPFGGTVAALTRWEHKGEAWSLYQFSGKSFDLPATFQQETREIGEGKLHRHVAIWAGDGGQCTWALVMDCGSATCEANPFAYGGYGR